jgi:transcriptional regulator with XRE-family HTH domain
MNFAETLKQERERLGITQAQVASMIEVPARTYWEWEAAKTTPYEITQEGALARLRATKKRK